ncbi:hypothetical protein O7608_31365 [Solwaraspora sp. WMMA2056]|uniref:hypothetical protein n=1 Tax=Solwaraspora sp. WMMA2056 TaxID=3015161 RepID=UPI00259B6E96|nr:hypothetical protein [Solwaraspora sp. WMMA2056]WJK40817.1 hypothetical protein O7608_31365 [Solwaraspora sp. WMMA2056]
MTSLPTAPGAGPYRRDTPRGFAPAPPVGVSNGGVTGEAAVPEPGEARSDDQAARPALAPTEQSSRVPRRRPPRRSRLPSPWAAAGPEATWWHGGTPPDPVPSQVPSPVSGTRPTPAVEAEAAITDEADAPAADPPPVTVRPATPPARSGTPTPPARSPARASRRRRRRRRTRRPATGLAWILLVAAAAAFLGWVSAEPLWLAAGRGTAGTATVTGCTGDGLGQRCLGEFVAPSGDRAGPVRLLGVPPLDRTAGTELAAWMLHLDRDTAYVAADLAGLHLRWTVGWALIALLALVLVWGSGARRLASRAARRGATLLALAAPLLLGAGFLVAGW